MGHQNKSKNCKKLNVLVYVQPAGEKSESRLKHQAECPKIPICKGRAKRIQVCTGADLKKMCPIPECRCKPPPHRIRGIIRLGVKGLIAAAAVYATMQSGIWGTTDETQSIFTAICNGMQQDRDSSRRTKWDPPPACQAEMPLFAGSGKDICEEPPINMERQMLRIKENWNKIMGVFFNGLVAIPARLRQKEEEDDDDEDGVKAKKQTDPCDDKTPFREVYKR